MHQSPQLVVVIPYRDRPQNLERLIPTLTQHLRGMPHEIVVVEQSGDDVFNKGRLLNIGFDLHRGEGDYFCFHDVDLLPETAECDYSLPEGPTHLSMYCSQFDYEMPYAWACGGVLLVPRADFQRLNGYSNEYWGWGAEDDDLALRSAFFGVELRHRPGRYISQPHELGWNQTKLPSGYRRNVERLRSHYDYSSDGLSSLRYRLLETTQRDGYLHHLVDVGRPPSLEPEDEPTSLEPESIDPTVFWSERRRAPLALSIVRHALEQRLRGGSNAPKRTVPQAIVELMAPRQSSDAGADERK